MGHDIKPPDKIEIDLDEKEDKIYPDSILDQYFYYHPYLKKRGIDIKTAKFFGLGYDAASDRITIPIRDHQGNLVGIQARTVKDDNLKYIFLLPCQKSRVLYALHGIRDFKAPIILTEGSISVIKLWRKGAPAIASLGANISEYQENLLRYFDKVYCFFDCDEAGRKGIQALRESNLRNLYFPTQEYEDIDDLSEKDIKQLIRTSKQQEITIACEGLDK